MRTEKELWQIVLDHPELFMTGLCDWVKSLYLVSNFNREEYYTLYNKANSSIGYWIGPKGQIQPRIDWIKKRMEEL